MRPRFPILMMAFVLAGLFSCSEPEPVQEAPPPAPLRNQGTLSVSGMDLNYKIEGAGRPCLVIGSSIYYPRVFSEDLKDQLKMYFVDMRWFGEPTEEISLASFTLDRILQDIDSVRQAFGLEKPIILGHSIHGAIASEYVRAYPNQASALVMVGSPVIFGNPAADEAAAKAWTSASERRRAMQYKNWQEQPNQDSLSGQEKFIANYVAMGPKYWYDSTYDASALWKDMTIHTQLTDRLYGNLFSDYDMFARDRQPEVPSLAIMGKHDYVIPYAPWQERASLPNLQVEVLSKSGHTPQLEEPEKFDQTLMDWVETAVPVVKNDSLP